MKTKELFKNKTVLSFEVFPPKRTAPADVIYKALDGMRLLKPDFISVTYGAGGSENRDKTLEIVSAVKNQYGIESAAHLPCLGLTKKDVVSFTDNLKKRGIENVLALRGDPSPSITEQGDFTYASDLISFLKEQGSFNIMAACYPEGHTESNDIVSDIQHLKMKVDAGADHLISQLFFDNEFFYRFRERCALAQIDVPIEAGIMPVTNKKQIERMVTLCGATLPRKFSAIMNRYENNPEALRDAGIAYAIDQIVDLVTQGVDGIHLYTMNNPYVATKIYEAVHRLFSKQK